MVLNASSAKRFGGSAETGAVGWEEELFRKTDYGCHPGKEFYPIFKNEYVVTRDVTILKNGSYEAIANSEFRKVDMIAMAAIKQNEKKEVLSEDDYLLTKTKIQTIFLYAIYHQYTALVLGALGCGVFKNPPPVISSIFKEVIVEYGGYFDRIVFSVFSGSGNENFDIFRSTLQS